MSVQNMTFNRLNQQVQQLNEAFSSFSLNYFGSHYPYHCFHSVSPPLFPFCMCFFILYIPFVFLYVLIIFYFPSFLAKLFYMLSFFNFLRSFSLYFFLFQSLFHPRTNSRQNEAFYFLTRRQRANEM